MNMNKKILALEDDIVSQKLLEIYAQDILNTEIIICKDDVEFKKMSKKQEFDLLMIDINIPGKENGLDLLQFYHKTFKRIPTIVFSAYVEEKDDILEKYDIDEFIEKPFFNKSFTSIIKKYLYNSES